MGCLVSDFVIRPLWYMGAFSILMLFAAAPVYSCLLQLLLLVCISFLKERVLKVFGLGEEVLVLSIVYTGALARTLDWWSPLAVLAPLALTYWLLEMGSKSRLKTGASELN